MFFDTEGSHDSHISEWEQREIEDSAMKRIQFAWAASSNDF